MYKYLLNWLALTVLLPSCSGTTPQISVVCEENNIGNSIVKWEMTPLAQGSVKVYASTDPNSIPENIPIAMANISDLRMTIVTSDPTQRYYYSLVFADKYRVKVATRNVNIPGVQNFRDLGGYHANKKKTCWGMLYRSAAIDSLECGSLKELKNLGIKTIIDLRGHSEAKRHAALQQQFNIVHIPIATGDMEDLVEEIKQQRIKRDDVSKMVEQMNRDLINKYTKEYRQVFDILLDKNNYPIVMHCSSGKGRTGVVSALILAALNINKDVIMEDYRLSNYYFDIPATSKYAYNLPAGSQEAITTVFSARENFLNAAKQEAERNYGDIENYLKEGVGLSKEETKRLRSILLN